MASLLKNEDLVSYRRVLNSLRSRLRGDLNRMTDEALRRENNGGGGGSLSSVPLHMADLGTENYDQEFTLGLIENEQGTLDLINEALDRVERGTFGQCTECREPISKSRLQAIPYAKHCIRCARKLEGGE
jgi:DnaK suppressor protein